MICRRNEKKPRSNVMMFCCSIAALMTLVVWAPNAEAFPVTTNCISCHGIWAGGGGVGHTGHNGLGLPQSCNTCHGVIGDTPVTARCGTCHMALGLANHHQNSGATSCTGCHPGTPPPENTPVPGYATITAALDPCNGTEERFASFTVSLDNDGDLLTDGADPDCAAPVEICTDGVDNDGDGMVDCADTDCSADLTCLPETDCNDGIDNDSDGLTDCDDQDCATDPACETPTTEVDCADGVDNDGDSFTDCADPDCSLDPACPIPDMEICTDDIDNDGDGLIDCDDSDCSDAANCQPPTLENCTDGVDNDGDGMIDCDDQDCANNPACQQPVMEDCDDGVDNDNDGFIDCKDPDCSSDPACMIQETCPSFNPPPNHTKRENDDGCEAFHAPGYEKPYTNGCTACHGSELTGPESGGFAPSCYTCHDKEWDENAPGNGGGGVPADHTNKRGHVFHKPGLKKPFINGCTSCHGQDLKGDIGPSCYDCHKMKWKDEGRFDPPADHTKKHGDNFHKPGLKEPFDNGCTDCHGSKLTGSESGGFAPSCFLCHGEKWKDGDRHKRNSYDHDDDDDDSHSWQKSKIFGKSFSKSD